MISVLLEFARFVERIHSTSVFSWIISEREGERVLGTRGCFTLSSMYSLCDAMTSFKALTASCSPCVTSNTMVMSSLGWSLAYKFRILSLWFLVLIKLQTYGYCLLYYSEKYGKSVNEAERFDRM